MDERGHHTFCLRRGGVVLVVFVGSFLSSLSVVQSFTSATPTKWMRGQPYTHSCFPDRSLSGLKQLHNLQFSHQNVLGGSGSGSSRCSRFNSPRRSRTSRRGASHGASEASSSTKVSPKFKHYLETIRTETRAIASALLFVSMDVLVRRGFQFVRIDFPSSLAACGMLLALLLALPRQTATSLHGQVLQPGAKLLAKWLPLFFVPSLIGLPLGASIGSATEVLKVALVIVGGFLFSLLTTSFSVVAVRRLTAQSSKASSSPVEDTTWNWIQEQSSDSTRDTLERTERAAKDLQQGVRQAASALQGTAPQKPFSDELFRALLVLTVASGAVTLGTAWWPASLSASAVQPFSALFLLLTTLTSFVWGARLPTKVTKLLHPLVTCTSLTWTVTAALATLTGRSFLSVLSGYRTGSLRPLTAGPGDVLLFLLGPSVVSFALSMYERRQLIRENVAAVATAVLVATVGGIFGTAWAVRWLAIGNPYIRLSLLSRNITSPLAMAMAAVLGADVSLAVSMVVITGLLGANFGASLLDAVGIRQDAIARGLGIGAAAHGLGTAALVQEKEAFPFAAIAMALTASAATITVSIPPLRRLALQLALGW